MFRLAQESRLFSLVGAAGCACALRVAALPLRSCAALRRLPSPVRRDLRDGGGGRPEPFLPVARGEACDQFRGGPWGRRMAVLLQHPGIAAQRDHRRLEEGIGFELRLILVEPIWLCL